VKEVEERFRNNFAAARDSGSGLCVFGGEKKLISLYGGFLDADCLRRWREDTLVGICCGTKGVVVACLLHAMQEAGVGLDSRISDFWPEFAQGEKREITLGQLLSHRSGLCALNDAKLQMLDKDGIVRCIEKQYPLLPPNAGPAYSPHLIGYALEEILRRMTGGETLGDYWRRVFGDPLEIDLWIGLPESENVRVAATSAPQRGMLEDSDVLFARAIADPYSLAYRAFTRPAKLPGALAEWNTPRIRAASLPSLGGIASAQGLAKFYAMLANGGTQNGRTFFKRQILDWMSTRLSQGFDPVLQCEMAFSAGFQMDPLDDHGQKKRHIFGASVSAFGHVGVGGSLGFADPERGIGFAYLMSHWEPGVLPRERCTSLVDAIYKAD
jgi:CubicO group peptidase (beta-lactamase class C family)